MKRKLTVITIILSTVFFISFSALAQDFKVGFVTDIGGVEDNHYNEQLLKAFNKIRGDLNIKFEYKESDLMSEYLSNINYFAEKNYDLIWGVGYTMEQAVKEAAQLYPEINFVIFDALVEEENVLSIDFKEEEEAFLAGVIAALESKTAKIAFIGGRKNSKILSYQNGFVKGAQTAAGKTEVITEYIGSFNDYSKAKDISSQLIAKNVDIIFYTAGAAGRGVIKTAVDNNVKLISLDQMDKKLAPENMITVILKNVDQIAAEITDDFYNDDYLIEVKEFGIAEDAFILDLDQAKKMMSANSINKIDEYINQLLKDEVEIIN